MSNFLGGREQEAPPAKSGGFFGLGGLVSNLIENVTNMNVNDEEDSDESYGDFEAGELDEEEMDDFELEDVEVDLDQKYDVGKSVINRGLDGVHAFDSTTKTDSAEGADEPGYMGACLAEIFQTRVGPNYNKTKKKAPSAPAMLECMSVE
jgi:hypothetical protein